ncbi:ABC transporter substrate-binding protein [Sodalis sp. dw_96]|uniref:ABC transporter substrate-binding protein n=1 Tax=Sodalis sp. dw_96 TaxID=2719794 RepID=UPI001BD40140|nr:ABC transporter substrate-binding protein [Sodalis sp. dw_96]
MRFSVKHGAALMVLAATLSVSAWSVQGAEGFTKLRVAADPSYRPISFQDPSGKLVGFDADFAAALGKHMGVPVSYEGMAWDGIIPALQGGKIDAITNLVISDDRKKVVAFSEPIMTQTIVLVVKAHSGHERLTAANLGKLRVGVMVNTAAATALQSMKDVTPTTYNTVVDAYNDLMLGRIDVVAVESVNGTYIVASQYAGKLAVVKQPLTNDVKLNGVALRKQDTAGLKQVNTAIDKMKADGTLAAIAVKWFGNADNVPK